MADKKYFVLCNSNCKYESLTREQIIAAIAEATGNTVTDVDEAFITKIKEQNTGAAVKFWVGTQAEYNAIVAKGEVEENTLYCTSDGSAITLLSARIDNAEVQISANEALIDGLYSQNNQRRTEISALGERVTVLESTSGKVSGTVAVKNGGTGATTAAKARTNLGIGNVATENVLPVSKGGTGATDAANARLMLGLGAVATSNIVSVARGGTGANYIDAARENLGIYVEQVEIELQDYGSATMGHAEIEFPFVGKGFSSAVYFATVSNSEVSNAFATVATTATVGKVSVVVSGFPVEGTQTSGRCTVNVLALAFED